MCVLVCQISSWIVCCLCLCLSEHTWFQGTNVLYLHFLVVPDSLWHVMSYVDTETECGNDWFTLWSFRNPCWQLLSWRHVCHKASECTYYTHIACLWQKMIQVQIKPDSCLIQSAITRRTMISFSTYCIVATKRHMNWINPASSFNGTHTHTECMVLWNW